MPGAAYQLYQCAIRIETTLRFKRTPEVARMMVDISSVVFWPSKSCANDELLINVNSNADVRSGLPIALVLAVESRRP